MTYCRYFITFIFFSVSSYIPVAFAADEAEPVVMEEVEQKVPLTSREKDISQNIERELTNGDTHWLGSGDDQFLALYNVSELPQAEGSIILLHDLRANADWPQLISPLRVRLPKAGWNTLSIQLPMLNPGEERKEFLPKLDKAVERVGLALEFLKQEQSKKIVFIGHGFGAATAVLYLTRNPEVLVSALVGLSLPGANSLKYTVQKTEPGLSENPLANEAMADVDELNPQEKSTEKISQEPVTSEKLPDEQSDMAVNESQAVVDQDFFAELEKLKLPLLDIYASEDHLDVTREANKRSLLMHKAGHKNYLQMQITGAGHYFVGVEDRLTKRIRGWMRKNARPL